MSIVVSYFVLQLFLVWKDFSKSKFQVMLSPSATTILEPKQNGEMNFFQVIENIRD